MLYRNRDNYRYSKSKSSSWCPKCDRDIIGDYGKCSVCGYRKFTKLRLKPPKSCLLGNF